MRFLALALVCAMLPFPRFLAAEEKGFELSGRVVFLGDSITHAGEFISILETRARAAGKKVDFINLGLPSETCSGLSEPKHPFPRPNVLERLDRVLEKTKPEIVVVCYGMNDGIYYPFSEKRYMAYRRGINVILGKAKIAGAKVVLCTPPAFDPLPMKKRGQLRPAGAKEYAWTNIYENYDDVMKQYAEWILRQRQRVAAVVDLHSAINNALAEKRKTNPDYTMSNDGVHINAEGHLAIANAMPFGKKATALPKALHALVVKRQKLMHPAWLSHVGHKRPGVKPGLPIEKALEAGKKIEREIAELK